MQNCNKTPIWLAGFDESKQFPGTVPFKMGAPAQFPDMKELNNWNHRRKIEGSTLFDAVPPDEDDEEVPSGNNNGSRNSDRLALPALVCLLAAIGVTIAVGLSRSEMGEPSRTISDTSNTAQNQPGPGIGTSMMESSPTYSPSFSHSPTSLFSSDRLIDLADKLELDLVLVSDDEREALEWLAYEDPAEPSLERFILSLFYFSTGGETSWRETYSFLTNRSICEWNNGLPFGEGGAGVYCDGDEAAAVISIENNNMVGTVPTRLGQLESLVWFAVPKNKLRGIFPDELHNLSGLLTFNVESNDFSGTIPQAYENLKNLHVFSVANNRALSGTLPQGITELPNLTTFSAFSVNLTGTIPDFASQPGLTFIAIAASPFQGKLPKSLWNLPSLESLFIMGTEVTGTIPTTIGAAINLRHLYLASNMLTGTIPSEVRELGNLKELLVEDNLLSGTMPGHVFLLSKLQTLTVNDNPLGGGLPEFAATLFLPELDRFQLHRTNLSGDLDISFCFIGRYPSFFSADCNGTQPEVVCSCCNVCCQDNAECVPPIDI